MLIKKYSIFFFILLTVVFSINIFSKLIKTNKKIFFKNTITKEENEITSNSNLIKDVEYAASDQKGNEYLVKAKLGEIDINNKNIIFLTGINAVIKLKNKDLIKISSRFGKYNILNNDTIFSKDVALTYNQKKINADYLDLSTERSSILFSKNVIYKDINNILYADVINMDIITKELKIFMHDSQKKVKINNLK